jgi:hypothetical protein
MTRFLTLVLVAASFLAVSCASMKKKDECGSCCDSGSGKSAMSCCDSDKPHKH